MAGMDMVLGTSVDVVVFDDGVGCGVSVLLTSIEAVAYSSMVVMRTAPLSRTSVPIQHTDLPRDVDDAARHDVDHVRVHASLVVVASFKRTVDPE